MAAHRTKNTSRGQGNELSWILTLFGTAVGAGILYLPLQAGVSGIWALIFLSALVFPLIYFAHKNIMTLLLSEKTSMDYSGVAAKSFNKPLGFLIVLTFLITFFAVLFSYAIGLNANLGAYLVEYKLTENNWAQGPFLSLIIMLVFALLHLVGKDIILKVMSAVSMLLILFLLGTSIYLIPFWDLSLFSQRPSFFSFTDNVLLVLPILTFSFVFFPAMSSMVVSFRKPDGSLQENAHQKINAIVFKTSAMLLFFVLFFVYSCIFSLSPEEFEYAIKENLNCLNMLSSKKGISPALANIGALMGIAALCTSFIGVLFAVRESAYELIVKAADLTKRKTGILNNKKALDYCILGFIFLSLWIITMINPSVINMFGLFVAPLIAVFLFILPVLLLIKKQGLQILKKASCLLVLLIGILILFSYELGTLLKAYHI